MRSQLAIAIPAIFVTTLACNNREIGAVTPGPSIQRTAVVEATRQNLDLLFVIDNSGSMFDEHQSLIKHFPQFIEILDGSAGGRPNLHVGITSTDLGGPPGADQQCQANGDSGQLIATPRVETSCSGPDDRYFVDIEGEDGARVTNFDGTLGDAFGCIANLGTQGCGFEQPLEAMHRALSSPQNDGFLRDNSILAVIFITDEDDCSMHDNSMMLQGPECSDYHDETSCPLGARDSFRCFEFGVECEPDAPRQLGSHASCKPREDSPYLSDIEQYVATLRDHKSPERLIVAAIAGDRADPQVSANDEAPGNPVLSPSCASDFGAAAPPIRLASFLDQIGNSTHQSICDEELGPAIEAVATEVRGLLGDHCMPGYVDLMPESEQLIVDCAVTDTVTSESGVIETVLAPCGQDDVLLDGPCWVATRDALACPDTATHVAIRVDNRPSGPPPAGRQTIASCLEILPP